MPHDDDLQDFLSGTSSRRALLLRGAAGVAALTGAQALLSPAAALAESARLSARPSRPTGVLKVANPGEPNFIDPPNSLELTEFSMVRNVYDSLTEWNSTFSKQVGSLATGWSSNKTATVWTFQLRKGVTFHDGTPFDARAAKTTIEYYIGKTWGLAFANLKRVVVASPDTLRLEFSKPAPDLLRDQPIVRMISPKLLAAKASTKRAVGTGAFTFKQWNKGRSIILAANPNYWGNGPYLSEVDLITVADPTNQVNALKTGAVDLIMKVQPLQLKTLTGESGFHEAAKKSWVENHMIFRCDQDPVSNVLVRQACAWAIDRQAIVSKVLLGQATVADSPMPFGTYGRVEPPTKYTYDPDKAKALLKQAGLSSGTAINLACATAFAEFGQVIAQQLTDAGIKATLNIMESGLFVADLTAKVPKNQAFLANYGWLNGGPFSYSIGIVLGHAHYTGADMVDLVNAVSTTADGPKRLSLLAQLQDTHMKQLPHLPLFYPVATDVFKNNLLGYSNPKDGYMPVFSTAYRNA